MANIFSERNQMLDRLKKLRFRGTGSVQPVSYFKCTSCLNDISSQVLKEHLYLCPHCGGHIRMPGYDRLEMVLDPGTIKELFTSVRPKNPIGFPEYEQKLKDMNKQTGLDEACLCADGRIAGERVICAVLDSSFMMGSMGTAVGEKVTLAAEYAQRHRAPLIIFSASGGARMQEGIFSLMQMAKTSAAVKQFSDSGGFFISCITHPTTGGVTASFASLGDITLAEPGALFGFAGPRVIEQTIRQKLPEGFQRSEFQQEHGFVDAIVPRQQMRETLVTLILLHRR